MAHQLLYYTMCIEQEYKYSDPTKSIFVPFCEAAVVLCIKGILGRLVYLVDIME